jgi:MFS family permease
MTDGHVLLCSYAWPCKLDNVHYFRFDISLQALGPIVGGALTLGFNWRAIFWFLAIVSGTSCLCFLLFFNDTFRQERSLTYQDVLQQQRQKTTNQSVVKPCDVEALAHMSKQNVGDASAEKHSSEGSAANDEIEITTPVKLSLRDVNPFKPLALVLRRWNNVLILFSSGKPRA